MKRLRLNLLALPATLATLLPADEALGALPSSESVLNPAGPQARSIGGLTWLFIVVCVVVFSLVMITLAGALSHRRPSAPPDDRPVTEPEPTRERRLWRVVWGAVAVTVVTLFVLLIGDFATGRSLQAASRTTSDPLRIKVIAHQWWWEIHYQDWPDRFGERVPSNMVVTANEIHVPVDPVSPATVELQLDSSDVIHSFWLPNLSGKRDMVPGHPTSLWFQADRPGMYWGECAEYCGYQHAQMRLTLVAEPVDQFSAWLTNQRRDAPEPANATQQSGREVFLGASCAMCHAVGGTEARGSVGPNLTHIASRRSLAAGALPNTTGHLAGWIVDPQRIKPGVRMPQNNLSPFALRALIEYLESLQ